jgi:glycerol-3-phosphate acyltransferase PlsY
MLYSRYMETRLFMIALPVIAYLVGSIPFGLLIVRWVRKIDIRQTGSGNIGATNVRRTAGTSWGVATLICDALKGALPTYAALVVQSSGTAGLPSWVALAAVCGHMYPVYFRFKPSGKGVATALGCFAVLSPLACGIALLIFIGLVLVFRRVSVASMGAMGTLPIIMGMTKHDLMLTIVSALIAGLIVYRHKENIQRLLNGSEPPVGKSR